MMVSENQLMNDDKSENKDSWLKAFNTIANIVVITALVATVFGLFATYGALMMINIFY